MMSGALSVSLAPLLAVPALCQPREYPEVTGWVSWQRDKVPVWPSHFSGGPDSRVAPPKSHTFSHNNFTQCWTGKRIFNFNYKWKCNACSWLCLACLHLCFLHQRREFFIAASCFKCQCVRVYAFVSVIDFLWADFCCLALGVVDRSVTRPW